VSNQNEIARFINPPTMPKPVGYTHVVEVSSGKTVYISGQVALDASGNVVGQGGLRAQTRQVFANLKAGLAAVGADFTHVVKFTIFMLDASQIQIIREVRDQYVNLERPPASSAVEVRRLAREEFLIEVEAIAVIPT
jgi:reactive intermediate/imine deaminase